jgi:putative flippase GtrA
VRHATFFHNIINRLKTDEVHGQFLWYATIGIILNTALYLSYITLTHTFMSSLAAMTITYSAGVLLGFILNRKITFGHQGNEAGALLRYISSYLVGYIYNFIALLLLVDYAGYPHEAVQAGVIVTLWVLLFALQRYWVFPGRPSVRRQARLRSSTS